MSQVPEQLHAETMARVTRRILPFVMLLFLVAYLDRSNISVAALQMNTALGMNAQQFGFGAGIFFLTYILLEFPSNLILARVGARRWIARIMVSWGVVACAMALIQSAGQFAFVRVLLGAAEAGFTPGIIYYLGRWYPRADRAQAVSWFYIGAALASVIGLPISGALLSLDGVFGVAGWRWLFLLEGLPAVILGVCVLWLLPDSPADVDWLNPQQKSWLESTLAREVSALPVAESAHWSVALRDRRVWLFSLVWLLQAFGSIGVTLFLPQILKGLSGSSNFAVSLLSAAPFLLACVLMYFNGRHSDRMRERRWHLAVPLTGAGVALALAVASGNLGVSYALLLMSVALNWALVPAFWAAATEYISGVAGAGAAAIINSTANLAGLGLPPVIGWLRDTTGTYNAPLLLIAGALVLGGVLSAVVTPERERDLASARKPTHV